MLAALAGGDVADSMEFAVANGFDHTLLVDKCLKRLQAAEKIDREKKVTDGFKPTEEGKLL